MNIKRISVFALSFCAILTSCNSGFKRHSFNECDYTAFANALKSIKEAQSTTVSKVTKYNLLKEGNIQLINKTNTQYKTNNKVTTSYSLDLNNNYSWQLNSENFAKNFFKTVDKYTEKYISEAYGDNEEKVDSTIYGSIAKKSTDSYYGYYKLTNDSKNNKKYAEKIIEEVSNDFDYASQVTKELDDNWIVSGLFGYPFKGMITGFTNSEYFYGLNEFMCADTLPKLVRYYQEKYQSNSNYNISVRYGSNDNKTASVDFNAVADINLFNDLFINSLYIPEEATNVGGSTNISMFLAYEDNFISQVEFTVKGSYSYTVNNENCETSLDSYFLINRTNSCSYEDVNIKDFNDPVPELN